jgi:hypothetical protein
MILACKKLLLDADEIEANTIRAAITWQPSKLKSTSLQRAENQNPKVFHLGGLDNLLKIIVLIWKSSSVWIIQYLSKICCLTQFKFYKILYFFYKVK